MSDWHPQVSAEILRSEMAVAPMDGAALIGRSEDLAALDAALEDARGGDPVVILIAGEAGMGKTRLVQEFCERAYAQGARVLTGACVDLGESALPYAAVADALRAAPPEAYLELAPPVRRQLAALIPEASPDDEPLEGAQGALFGAVLRMLEQLGRQEPLVLVLEDVHWADPSTRDMLTFLVSGLRQTAVLLVLTHRTDEVGRDHPVRKLLTELQRAPRVQRLELAPLTRKETSRQLTALNGGPMDRVLVDAIYARSDGNPLFSEELLATGAGADSVPSSLRDALLARLDGLPSNAQTVARVAAALGRDVDHELLAHIADAPDHELDDALRACVSGHVLVVDGAGRGYRFRHALLQEVAAEELLPGERARLHRRIADALEAQPAAGGSAGARRLAEIAHHRLLARDAARGLGAALEAARAAEDVHAMAEASASYDVALELWDAVDPPARPAGVDLPGVLERAANCRFIGTADAQGSLRLLERALDELGDDAPPLRRAGLMTRIGRAHWRATANLDTDLEMQEQALALLDGEPSQTAALVKSQYASGLMMLGDFERSARAAAEAVEIARAAGARVQEADALVTQFVCAGVMGDEAATRTLIEEARGPVLESMEGSVVRRFFTNSAFVLHGFARYEEGLAVALDGIEAERRAGTNPHGQMCMYENAAELMCILGRPQEAADLLGDEVGAYSSDTAVMHTARGLIALQLGDLRAAETEAARAIAGLDAADVLLLAAVPTLAEAALWNGNVAVALDACARGEAVLVEDDQIAASSLLAMAIRAQSDGAETGALDLAEARVEADRLLARLERVVNVELCLPEPRARRLSGVAERSRLADEPDPAAWQAVSEAWSAIGRRYEAAHTGWRWAEAIAASHGPRDELERVLSEAHGRAADIGSTHLVEVCEALARRSRLVLPGMKDDDGSAFPDLTPREREVLALVADGRTNRQIAQELFITDKTASVHVSNILAKLGVSTRLEAAALAHRRGLVQASAD
jgi:ATP/maltotriose-dependent transcriptional regulator MalT